MNARTLPAPMLRDRPRNTLYKVGAAILRAHYQQADVEDAAVALFGRDHGLGEILRAASNPATLTNPGWAGAGMQNLIRGDLIQQITALSAAAALMEAGVRIDLSGIASITIPSRLFDPASGGAATTVPPSAAIGAGGWIISNDVGALVQALANAGGGLDPVLIAAPTQAAALRMWKQEDFFDVFASTPLAAGTVIAVEASSFVSAVDAIPNFSVSTGTLIHQEDTSPADIVSAGGVVAAPVRSYFQTDSIGLRMVLRARWGLRNPAHVAIVEGVAW